MGGAGGEGDGDGDSSGGGSGGREDGGGNPWDDEDEPDPYDLDFEIPRSEDFAARLSGYGLYQAPLNTLQPAEGTLLYELSSELFTDYAHKQRLVKVPEGTVVTRGEDDRLVFPEGSILAKTFYYPIDMRDLDSSLQIIETRLLVKTEGQWNVATYLWNPEQTDATLLLDGTQTDISWIDDAGQRQSTEYAVPKEEECVTCHQLDEVSSFIGPTVLNLNRMVSRGGGAVNQLAHLNGEGVFAEDWSDMPALPNFKDTSLSLEQRARAYLEINCAHCHRPGAWDESGEEAELDLRYTTPLAQTGIEEKERKVRGQLERGEMPFLGTTLPDEEGIQLIIDYVNSLN